MKNARASCVQKLSSHNAIIEAVLAKHPGAKRNGFFAALRRLPDAEYFTELMREDPEWVSKVRLVPDAFIIDAEDRAVIVFESVVTNDLSDAKFSKYAEIGWALDEDYWKILVVRCDRFGARGYSPLEASYQSSLDQMNERTGSGWNVVDWARYSLEACDPLASAIGGAA